MLGDEKAEMEKGGCWVWKTADKILLLARGCVPLLLDSCRHSPRCKHATLLCSSTCLKSAIEPEDADAPKR